MNLRTARKILLYSIRYMGLLAGPEKTPQSEHKISLKIRNLGDFENSGGRKKGK